MPEAPAAPAPVVAEPTKPAPVPTGSEGAAALTDAPGTKPEPVADDPYEVELDVKGQKQKIKFANKEQLKAVLQKALYADQTIKDATQAKKGAAELMAKLKTPQGLREVLSDPDINVDIKRFALGVVQEMMDDEKLTPEQREARAATKERDELKAWKEQREKQEQDAAQAEKNKKLMAQVSGEIITAMKKYPDIPQTQATMDACIQNMRAAFKRFGKHLTAEQAMSVYSEQYWTSLGSIIDKMEPDAILKRFGQKTLDKIQKLKLQELRDKTNPANKTPAAESPATKKKHMTEKEYEKHFQTLAGL
jgi:uncharacterized membrane protein YheB (UPF0754 family)